jgi:hypothetical protein
MCDAVKYHGRWYNSPRELTELVGDAHKLVWRNESLHAKSPVRQDLDVMDLCLCPVDLETTLKNAGLKWTRGVDPMEWFIQDQTKTD